MPKDPMFLVSKILSSGGKTKPVELAQEYLKLRAEYLANYYVRLAEAQLQGECLPKEEDPAAWILDEILDADDEEKARISQLANVARDKIIDVVEIQLDEETGDFKDDEKFDAVGHALPDALQSLILGLEQSLQRIDESPESRILLLGYARDNPKKRIAMVAQYLETGALTRSLECVIRDVIALCTIDPFEQFYIQQGRHIETVQAAHELLANHPRKHEWYEEFLPQIDGWSLALGDALAECGQAGQYLWRRVFELARHGASPKPTKIFQKDLSEFKSEVSEADFAVLFDEVEAAFSAEAPIRVWHSSWGQGFRHATVLARDSVPVLRGIVRISKAYPTPRTFLTLERLLDKSFEKLRDVGPRCEALGQEVLDAMVATDDVKLPAKLQTALDRHRGNKNIRKRILKAIESIRM